MIQFAHEIGLLFAYVGLACGTGYFIWYIVRFVFRSCPYCRSADILRLYQDNHSPKPVTCYFCRACHAVSVSRLGLPLRRSIDYNMMPRSSESDDEEPVSPIDASYSTRQIDTPIVQSGPDPISSKQPRAGEP